MKISKNILIILLSIFLLNNVNAQKSEKIKSSEIKCAKYIYQKISIDDKKNQILFKNDKSNYKTFIDFVKNQIIEKGIIVYDTNYYNSFNNFLEINGSESYFKNNPNLTINSYIIKQIVLYNFENKPIKTKIIGITPVLDSIILGKIISNTKIFNISYGDIFYDYLNNPTLQKVSSKTYYDFFEKQKFSGIDLSISDNKFQNLFVNIYENQSLLGDFIEYETQPEKQILQYKQLKSSEIKFAKYKLETIYIDSFPALFYPIKIDRGYQNFFNFLMNAVQFHNVNVYDEIGYNIFSSILTLNDFKQRTGEEKSMITIETEEGWKEFEFTKPFDASQIKMYLVKEICFYGYKNELLETRTIGICPVRQYFREDDMEKENPLYKKLGWFYFPEIQTLASQKFATQFDFSEIKTYEQIFFNQDFNGVDLEDTTNLERNQLMYPSFTNCYVNYRALNPFKYLNNITLEADSKIYMCTMDLSKAITKQVFTMVAAENNNYQIFEPANPQNGYKSLIDIILDNREKFTFYDAEIPDKILTNDELNKNLGYKIDSFYIDSLQKIVIIEQPYNTYDIQKYKLEEKWYYDDKNELIKKEVVAIYPIINQFIIDINGEKIIGKEVCKINLSDFFELSKTNNVTKLGEYLFENIYYEQPEIFDLIDKNLFLPKPDMSYWEYFKNNMYNYVIISE